MRGSGIVKNWQVDRCNVPRDTGRVKRELVGESVVPLAPYRQAPHLRHARQRREDRLLASAVGPAVNSPGPRHGYGHTIGW